MDSHISQQNTIASPKNSVVSVAFPIAIPGLYDYRIPGNCLGKIAPGTPVLVEVKRRETWGVAVQIKDESEFPQLKTVLDIRTGQGVDDSQSLFRLYEWMASYYQCDLGRVFRPLISKGLISTRSKTVLVYATVPGKSLSDLKTSYQQILQKLASNGAFTTAQAEKEFGIKPSSINYLFKKGYLQREKKEIIREAEELARAVEKTEISLTSEQMHAVMVMEQALENPQKPFLLYGITGSGKTHVYTELASQTLKRGKSVIILVPEISLTPQTIQRFRSALGDVIAVIHSHMSDGERRDSLQELVTGNKKVVIGVRSAVLAPMQHAGLIIVDEEHDSSYKQSDMEPRYNARDIAVMRGHFQGALVVLGSATPSLESYQNALSGKYNLIKLTERFGAAALPSVHVIDMNEEHKKNNWTPLSRTLIRKIQECMDRERQIILLLNRRGFSTVLICKDCGHTCTCPNCSVNLRYHRNDQTIKCHLCGFEQHAPDVCPSCRGEQIKYKGTAIQKAEEVLREIFPTARILRMDQDTTRRKGAHVSILSDFAEKKADILLGTQMVSKGLNFPGVALVGVIQADTSLHFPDFRASERTFQLLSQVAGRAGRADKSGEVIIQTYFPEETAIRAAQHHDYEMFFASEIKSRKELGYPPFGKLARIVVEGTLEENVLKTINEIARHLRNENANDLVVLGPSPAALEKIDNEYRYTLLLKSSSPRTLSSALARVRKVFHKVPRSLRIIIDVDPVNML